MGGKAVLNRRMDVAGHRIQEQLGHSPEQPTQGIGGPVECLGITFESDEARREYFLERLRKKLKDPEFRKIEGFPLGQDEDILALSDPPYYTACPNPFIEEFVDHYGKPYDPESDDYRREPFAADVSEGKNDPIYNAHSYHTKVPHKAIMRYILHYTEPGDVVFDGFCGTGMTGVAAQLCGDRRVIESLGYRTKEDGTILDEESRPISKVGARRAVLNDLSPAATFIAYNYNTPVDVDEFERGANRILEQVETEYGWMYLTLHEPTEEQKEEALAALRGDAAGLAGRLDLPFGRINYTVWSDVFVCPECSGEVVFWEAAVDGEAGNVLDEFSCPHCSARLKKKGMGRAWTTKFDPAIGDTVRQARQAPVLINYSVGRKRFEKAPDAFDFALIKEIEDSDIPYWFPTDRMPDGEESRRNDDSGMTHVHHFYTKRNLYVFSALFRHADNPLTMCALLGGYTVGLKTARFLPLRWINKDTGPMKPHTAGTLYVPSLNGEQNWFNIFSSRSTVASRASRGISHTTSGDLIECLSSSSLDSPSNSFDYIFTDPPFGGNLMYSELNSIWEAWLKVFTNNKPEAIENKVQGKGLLEYQELMTCCFEEYHRVLKPGRWMTVEFHNSKNSVWNAIQEALQRAGFVVADVRTLSKQQGTFKQVTSAAAVKQDLVISAYKPSGDLERRFELEAGTEEGVWDFVGTHLRQLPVFVPRDGAMEVVAERMNYLLYDRMVAFHVQRGVTVPISAAEFYVGLKQRYPERDGMFFAPDQVAEYDHKRVNLRELMELQLFITGEASAIQWLRQELSKKPQTFQELSPEFMKDLGWAKHEKPLELGDLLRENFLRYREGEPIPAQIISWMKQSARHRAKIAELEARAGGIPATGLESHDPELIGAAKDRWYVPDPNKAQDLEKLREGALLKEFDTYKTFKGRRLKVFRFEAVRAGFKKAWGERDYPTILDVAGKIPETVLQEDPKLLMWYDQALARTEG
jgi:DNA modification methylase